MKLYETLLARSQNAAVTNASQADPALLPASRDDVDVVEAARLNVKSS
jgi:hypothetical protein